MFHVDDSDLAKLFNIRHCEISAITARGERRRSFPGTTPGVTFEEMFQYTTAFILVPRVQGVYCVVHVFLLQCL